MKFSVDVTKDEGVKTVQFLDDGKTKVQGTRRGPATAVEYRSDEGRNFAVRVIVAPLPK